MKVLLILTPRAIESSISVFIYSYRNYTFFGEIDFNVTIPNVSIKLANLLFLQDKNKQFYTRKPAKWEFRPISVFHFDFFTFISWTKSAFSNKKGLFFNKKWMLFIREVFIRGVNFLIKKCLLYFIKWAFLIKKSA